MLPGVSSAQNVARAMLHRGVVIATMFVGQLETWLAIVATIVGGVAGSMLAVMAYLAGVAVLGPGWAPWSLTSPGRIVEVSRTSGSCSSRASLVRSLPSRFGDTS